MAGVSEDDSLVNFKRIQTLQKDDETAMKSKDVFNVIARADDSVWLHTIN